DTLATQLGTESFKTKSAAETAPPKVCRPQALWGGLFIAAQKCSSSRKRSPTLPINLPTLRWPLGTGDSGADEKRSLAQAPALDPLEVRFRRGCRFAQPTTRRAGPPRASDVSKSSPTARAPDRPRSPHRGDAGRAGRGRWEGCLEAGQLASNRARPCPFP